MKAISTGDRYRRCCQANHFPRRYYRAKLHEGELASPAMLKSGAGVVGAQLRVAVGAVGGQEVVVEASTNPMNCEPAGVDGSSRWLI